jgi:hypothetical protein
MEENEGGYEDDDFAAEADGDRDRGQESAVGERPPLAAAEEEEEVYAEENGQGQEDGDEYGGDFEPAVEEKRAVDPTLREAFLRRLLEGKVLHAVSQAAAPVQHAATQCSGAAVSEAGLQAPEDLSELSAYSGGISAGGGSDASSQALLRRLERGEGQARLARFLRAACGAMEAVLEEGRLESTLRPVAFEARRGGRAALAKALPSLATAVPSPCAAAEAAAGALLPLRGGHASSATAVAEAAWMVLSAGRSILACAQSNSRAGDFCVAYGPPSAATAQAWQGGVACGGGGGVQGELVLSPCNGGGGGGGGVGGSAQGSGTAINSSSSAFSLSSPRTCIIGVWTGPRIVPVSPSSSPTSSSSAPSAPAKGASGSGTAPSSRASSAGSAAGGNSVEKSSSGSGSSTLNPPTFVLCAPGAVVSSICFSPAGDVVIAGLEEGAVCLWALGEPNWLHPTLFAKLQRRGAGGAESAVALLRYPTSIRHPSCTVPSQLFIPEGEVSRGPRASLPLGEPCYASHGSSPRIVTVAPLWRDAAAAEAVAASEEAVPPPSTSLGVGPRSKTASSAEEAVAGSGASSPTTAAAAAAADAQRLLRKVWIAGSRGTLLQDTQLRPGKGLQSLLPPSLSGEDGGDESGSDSSGSSSGSSSGQFSQGAPFLPSFALAAAGAAWRSGDPLGTPHASHPVTFIAASEGGAGATFTALPLGLAANRSTDEDPAVAAIPSASASSSSSSSSSSAALAAGEGMVVGHESWDEELGQHRQDKTPSLAGSIAGCAIGGISQAALADTVGDTGRSSTGMLKVVLVGTFSTLPRETLSARQWASALGLPQPPSKTSPPPAAAQPSDAPPPGSPPGTTPSPLSAQAAAVRSAVPLACDPRYFFACVGPRGAVLVGSRAPECGSLGATITPGSAWHFLPRGAASTGCATAMSPNPVLPSVFAVGYACGSVALFSLHHTHPLAVCEAPWVPAAGKEKWGGSAAAPGVPPPLLAEQQLLASPIVHLFWVRARPTVLCSLSAAGALSLWDFSQCGAGAREANSGGGGGGGGELPAPLQVIHVLTPSQRASGVGVVCASSSGGAGRGGAPPSPSATVSLLLGLTTGACLALALHPAFSVPHAEEGAGLSSLLAALELFA